MGLSEIETFFIIFCKRTSLERAALELAYVELRLNSIFEEPGSGTFLPHFYRKISKVCKIGKIVVIMYTSSLSSMQKARKWQQFECLVQTRTSFGQW
jgi:hypothetical protein